MKTDLFQSCGHWWFTKFAGIIKGSIFSASSFRTWNSSTGIFPPQLLSKMKKSWQLSWNTSIKSIFSHYICHISVLKEWKHSSIEVLCFRPSILVRRWVVPTNGENYLISQFCTYVISLCNTNKHTHTGVHITCVHVSVTMEFIICFLNKYLTIFIWCKWYCGMLQPSWLHTNILTFVTQKY